MTPSTEAESPVTLVNQVKAAEILTVDPRTLAGWRYRGGGPPFVRIGNRVRYKVRDLYAWIEERTFQSTAEADELA